MYKNRIILLSLLWIFHTINAQNTLLISLPKTGTNLALKLLKTILNEKKFLQVGKIKRSLYWCHNINISDEKPKVLAFAPSKQRVKILKKLKTKIILLLRDPRQHIIALLRAIKKDINHKTIEWGIKNFPKMLAMQTKQHCFLKYKDINQCYADYLAWINQYPWVYVTTYEKLVGPQGGGDTALQEEEIVNICEFLGRQLDESQAGAIAYSLYGGTSTFKEGKIDTWKQHFSDGNKKLFKEVAGKLVIALGYEKSDEW